ncbi:MAG TPA: ubiquinone/menaquinone biosynthesis methyltransferase [Tepidisphaeraceae bacterium]|jgi:demethylmenaquinone methyltransferase/2-methoxy-6-polyprenyl-1,4-benzoquinol methylase|nr:ubiquinone/menaquinone biosynthesis methyltransferase [Tepidisphaeraceae bacterium]
MISTDSPIPSPTNDAPAWDDRLLLSPHTVADKRGRVQRMFAAIAPSYDLNNRLHSMWMDQHWRRKTVRLANVGPADAVVDVACGTGDLTLKFAQAVCDAINREQASRYPVIPPRDRVLGIDFTYEMLPLARDKAAGRSVKRVGGNIKLGAFTQFACGDATSLPLPDGSADVVSIAFGIRNVFDPAAAIREFYRILRPGGRLLILEFSLPTNALLRGFYNFYFRKILPRTATLISGDKTGAYKYLPESVNTFIGRQQMMQMMAHAGFAKVEQHPMTFGVSVCYRGVRES